MTEVAYWVVDAFTDRPLSGNPAAVVPLSNWPENAWLQGIAGEMNLSETAFFVPCSAVQEADVAFELRWFTPKVEVDLCGHATLAAAKVVSELQRQGQGGRVVFRTRSGELIVQWSGDRFTMDFPLVPVEPVAIDPGIATAMGCQPLSIWRSKFDYLIELGDPDQVRRLEPNLARLSRIPCRGFIVTAANTTREFDVISRFFAPGVGVDEDPVTGSAHATLADFWGRRLGKQVLMGYQASARGGHVAMEICGDRVLLGGQAVVFARGSFSFA